MNVRISDFLRLCLVVLLYQPAASLADDTRLPIFDAHIHYSQDVWEKIPPHDAIRHLREAGIVRAMVSSSGDDGTQMLYQADPNLVIPVLRPYRKRGTQDTWMYDQTIVPYLQDRLNKYRYVAIGEIHMQGVEAELPVIREVVQLAKHYQLMLHVHSDADAIKRIFKQHPDAQILWAHAGFEPAYIVRTLLEKYPRLWTDLSFRHEIFNNGRFLPEWRALLIDHSDRFMLGVDTYTPQRWLQIQDVMNWQRQFLTALPEDIAKRIAFENGERVIARLFNELLSEPVRPGTGIAP